MFCPDCGLEAKEDCAYCIICGYPIQCLRSRLREEDEASLGWADKIAARPGIHELILPEPLLVSFITGLEEPPKPASDDRRLTCERCGAKIEPCMLCPKCGDKLPGLTDNDPYLLYVLKGFYRIVFAPRHFALNFPYSLSAGTTQPLLYPGVFAAFFIFTLPFARMGAWVDNPDPYNVFIPSVVGWILAILATPVLVYLTNAMIHLVATLLGGKAQKRRTMRVLGAGLIWLFIIGTINNLCGVLLFHLGPLLLHALRESMNIRVRELFPEKPWTGFVILAVVFIGWQYAWMFGALYRLNRVRSFVLTLATYIAFFWWIWLSLAVVLPLRTAGLI